MTSRGGDRGRTLRVLYLEDDPRDAELTLSVLEEGGFVCEEDRVDTQEAFVLALEREDAVGHAINLGTGRPTTVLDVAAALANGLGVDLEPEIPGRFRAGDIRHCYADPTRARELLGFQAAVPFERGMADLVRWVADQEAEDGVESAAAELITRGLAR